MLNCSEAESQKLSVLLKPYDLRVSQVAAGQDIPGSFWGAPEAGLIGNILYVRPDTPVHSALHEACHYICMDSQRRADLDTNAGGDYDEENAVCFLQILLSDHIPGYNKTTMLTEMDEWGYSFRLGSSRRWFEEDAEDARNWLTQRGIIDAKKQPSWLLVR